MNRKCQIPNDKFQTIFKFQIPNELHLQVQPKLLFSLEFEHWEFVCYLELGIWNFMNESSVGHCGLVLGASSPAAGGLCH